MGTKAAEPRGHSRGGEGGKPGEAASQPYGPRLSAADTLLFRRRSDDFSSHSCTQHSSS